MVRGGGEGAQKTLRRRPRGWSCSVASSFPGGLSAERISRGPVYAEA